MITLECSENLSMYRHGFAEQMAGHLRMLYYYLSQLTSVTKASVIDTVCTIMSGHQAGNCFRLIPIESLSQDPQNKGNRLNDGARGRSEKRTRSHLQCRKISKVVSISFASRTTARHFALCFSTE